MPDSKSKWDLFRILLGRPRGLFDGAASFGGRPRGAGGTGGGIS